MRFDFDTLQGLEAELGDSFFVVDLERFRKNYHDFLDAFRTHYPRTTLAYSYKTNYLPKLCRLVNEWGGRAEVVSRLEYDLAQRLGVDPKDIVFNGPYKNAEDTEIALRQSSILNLDGFHQLRHLQSFAVGNGRRQQVKVGIRVTFELPHLEASRFGFDADGEDVARIFEQVDRMPGVELAGLHCHFLNLGQSPEHYAAIAERMLEISDQHFRERPPEYIDIGGGFASRRGVDGIYEAYAATVAPLFRSHFGDDGPELIVEPGYALTADTAQFVAKLLDVKRIASRQVGLVSASLNNVKPTPVAFDLTITPVRRDDSGGKPGPLDIVGYTCVEFDVLSEDHVGQLAVGDYLVFEDVGAYTNVLQPPFIRESPPMIAYGKVLGNYELLKARQTFEDFFASYVLD